jgi:hypothetical protein
LASVSDEATGSQSQKDVASDFESPALAALNREHRRIHASGPIFHHHDDFEDKHRGQVGEIAAASNRRDDSARAFDEHHVVILGDFAKASRDIGKVGWRQSIDAGRSGGRERRAIAIWTNQLERQDATGCQRQRIRIPGLQRAVNFRASGFYRFHYAHAHPTRPQCESKRATDSGLAHASAGTSDQESLSVSHA